MNRALASGAIWISAISVLAIPLTYYRSWILSQFGNEGILIAQFALILIFIQFIGTFGLLGGSSVSTNFIPRIESKIDKSRFIATYTFHCIILTSFLLLLLFIFPEYLGMLLGIDFSEDLPSFLYILLPIIALSQLSIYILNGLMRFKDVALLSNLQLLIVTLVFTALYILYPNQTLDNSFNAIVIVILIANIIVIAIAVRAMSKELTTLSIKIVIPTGYWKFSLFVHGNTICSFLYSSIDKLLVFAKLGATPLASYFIFLSIAELIRFVPNKIGQVFLASFSKMLSQGKATEVDSTYRSLTKIIVVLSTCVAIGLISYSQFISMVFGSWLLTSIDTLIILCVVINIGSIGGVNAMLALAYERSVGYLVNSIVQISVQLIVMLLLIDSYGVLGVVVGKAFGIILAQIGLYILISRNGKKIFPPLFYFVSQAFVVTFAMIHYSFLSSGHSFIQFLINTFVSMLVLSIFLYVVKFNPLKLYNKLKR